MENSVISTDKLKKVERTYNTIIIMLIVVMIVFTAGSTAHRMNTTREIAEYKKIIRQYDIYFETIDDYLDYELEFQELHHEIEMLELRYKLGTKELQEDYNNMERLYELFIRFIDFKDSAAFELWLFENHRDIYEWGMGK